MIKFHKTNFVSQCNYQELFSISIKTVHHGFNYKTERELLTKGYNSKMLYPVLYGIILQKNAANQVIELRKIIDDVYCI